MKQRYKVLITVAGLATVSIHLINKLTYSLATKQNLSISKQNFYYDWRFGKINYCVKGEGSPLLLVHNLTPGSSNYEYHKIIQDLSKNHQVYAIDLLGYGNSDKRNMTYTNFLYVQLISDFIKNVIGKKTDIIATGDSATIALMTSHNDPEAVNRMIFINPQSIFSCNKIPSKQTRLLKHFIDAPLFGTFLFNILTSKHEILKTFLNDYYFDPTKIDQKDILHYHESAHLPDYNSKFSLSSYIGKYTNTSIIHALKEVNQSILILEGSEVPDHKTIVENYTYYNISIETEYINKTKLLPHMENPSEVLSQINTFLN